MFRSIYSLFFAFFLIFPKVAAAGTVSYSFSGVFQQDDGVALFKVDLLTSESLLVFTTSGASGGFPTYLALFDDTGSMVQQQSGDPACSSGFSTYNASHLCNDAYLQEPPPTPPNQVLPPGSYFVALTQWDNTSDGTLSDPFNQQGNPNFTNAFNQCGSGTVYFCDPFTGQGDGPQWAVSFSFTNPSGSALAAVTPLDTPEPASAALCLCGVGSVLAWRRRTRDLN